MAMTRSEGRTGELPITDIDWFNPVAEAFLKGAEGLGIPADRRLQRRNAIRSGLFPALHPQRQTGECSGRVPKTGTLPQERRTPHARPSNSN